jgi:phenylalanyl-tRNA synthetase beta chain
MLQWGQKAREVDFFDAKGDVQALLAPLEASFEPAEHPAMHPGRCARVLLDGRAIGFIGELHPRWCQAWELPQAPQLFELDLAAVLQRPLPQAQPVARQQPVERDLALVVAERVTFAEVQATIAAAIAPSLLRSVVLFDVYRPKAQPVREGATAAASGVGLEEKSLAVRITLAREDATLTEAEIDAAMQAAVAELGRRTGARLRA